MAAKQPYPTGVRPLLLEETARRRQMEARFLETLESGGFREIILPIIDYVDPYAALTDRTSARQSYRFVDREGDLVAIRSDFTPMVARALAPSLQESNLPLKVFYRGDVIRSEASRLGTNRELFQIGAEIIGDAGPAADAEMLRLALALARAFDVEPLLVCNEVSIAAAFDDDAREALVTKRATETTPSLVRRLIAGEATLDDLENFAGTRNAARRLAAISKELASDPAFTLHLDDVDANSGYYTGLRFRLYARGSRATLAQGGRYDSLYGRFGTPAPAAGFTFTLDELD